MCIVVAFEVPLLGLTRPNAGLLPKLRRLDCCNNKLTRLPDEVTALDRLEEMLLSNNNLQALPENMGLMWRLKKVDVMNNKLTSLPETIQLLKYLRSLDCESNRLKRLHEFLATLVSLDDLKLQNNEPLKGMPENVLKAGDTEVIAYVQSLPKIATKPYRIKVQVVGEGSPGKTCIVDALASKSDRSLKRVKDEAPPLTDGVLVTNISNKTSSSQLEMSVWDFSGSAEYDSLIPMFICQHAIFLVVFDMMEDVRADSKDRECAGAH